MKLINNRIEMSALDRLPPRLYRIADDVFDNNCAPVLLIESGEDFSKLSNHGLEADNLRPGYVEIVETNMEDYYCAMFFKPQAYIMLIIPEAYVPSNFGDTDYNSKDGIPGLGVEYARLNNALSVTLTPEQREIYGGIKTALDLAVADIQRHAYHNGFIAAINEIYRERA